MNTLILQTLFFLVIAVITYLPYKGKDFKNVSWRRALILSVLFLLSSTIFVVEIYQNLYINLNLITLGIFTLVTLLWFFTPKIIRFYGKYPKVFLEEKINEMRFLAKLEPRTMTIKYFEVLFQQAGFLFIFLKILGNLPIDNRILLFTLIVGIFHLGNILFMHAKWTLIYFALSVPMAIVFGYMISQGFILLTASIHLAFYLIFNARYWFLKKEEIL